MQRRVIGLTFVAAGVVLGIVWAMGWLTQPIAPAAALLLFLVGASFFGKVGRFAEKLRPFAGKSARVQVWGSDLPGYSGSTFSVQSVQALGAGLHFYLRPLPDGRPTHLKIAQPRGTTISETGVEIAEAKYIQWAGRKIQKVEGEKALVVLSCTETGSVAASCAMSSASPR